MKYKLRGDYCFKTSKNEILRNKRDADGNVTEAVIIDSKVHEAAIKGQLHMLELIVEKKPEVKPPVNPQENPNDNISDSPESNDNGQQSLPLQGGSGNGKKGK